MNLRVRVMAPLTLVLLFALTTLLGPSAAYRQKATESLSAAEFSRLSREFSEEGGYFRSDNFTSNETPYLHVVDKLKQLGATGGVYLGVGPEQNYTYIAKIRPRLAILFDIRRQAIIQHLMYKAVFHLSPNRPQFLARLTSRPLPKEKAPALDAPIKEWLDYFEQAPADDKAYATNLADIRRSVQEDFKYPLSEADQKSLEHVYGAFRSAGVGISFSFRADGFGGGGFGGGFPNLKDLVLATDLNGKLGNFLASAEDYDFVRGMHQKNLIIPVVGDFGGKKAIAAVGDYLRKQGHTVTAFYLSNVEQYLFQDNKFADFANNVRKLPLTEKSLFIRSASGRINHPARLPNHRSATLLQQMTVFLRDFDEDKYPTYPDLLMTHYIAADKP